MALLQVQGVSKRFGARVVAEDLTFAVADGEALGVIGPNGAGKPTPLSLFARELAPTSGHVRLHGTDDSSLPPNDQARRRPPPPPAGLRRPGSAALGLAWLEAGRLDGFFEFGLAEWDMAAGVLLITEAGGLVGDLSGGHKYLESGGIVAGSPKVFKGLLQKIKPHLNDSLKR